MKKYLVLGIVVAVAAILLSLSFKAESNAELGPAFWGSAKAGRTISACFYPGGWPCYETVANANNMYRFPHNIFYGSYNLTDGCQNQNASYGGSPVRVDFCIPDPPLYNCNCD